MSRFRLAVFGFAACVTIAAPVPALAAGQPPTPAAAPVAVAAATVATAATSTCANADLVPTGANLARISKATLCLLNDERDSRGLLDLRGDVRLARAAADFSSDMVHRHFFDHVSPSGSTLVTRLTKVKYVARNIAWSVGENIGWGTGTTSTPRAIVNSWMASPGHRANILNRKYRDIGLGLVSLTPQGRAGGATFTSDFGRRG